MVHDDVALRPVGSPPAIGLVGEGQDVVGSVTSANRIGLEHVYRARRLSQAGWNPTVGFSWMHVVTRTAIRSGFWISFRTGQHRRAALQPGP